jgi:L-iditol 2-dehydrogenase
VIEAVGKLTGGDGADIVMETAGAVVTTQQTPHLVKRGGTVVLVGMAPQDSIDYNFAKLLWKEAEIKTVFRYRTIYPQAIQAMSEGKIDVSGIVTHEFAFDDIAEAFDVNINRKNDVVKIVIRID